MDLMLPFFEWTSCCLFSTGPHVVSFRLSPLCILRIALRMALIQPLRMANNKCPSNGLLESHSVEIGLSKLSMREVPALYTHACSMCLPYRREENSCLVQAGMQAICPNGGLCARNQRVFKTKEAQR